MEYNKLTTGNSYNIKDLFSKDNKIIIPDLQRDYCWGTTKNKDGDNLVRAFLDNLLKNRDNDLNLGLLYGYEAPFGHIQLCDGQQRITTLFLILGMLNKKTDDAFRRYLISETEENDDWEPYLQYAIRESSLYFMSDLTRYFFIKDKNLQVSDIKSQPWYFKDYDLDPSIQSMIAAMEIIEKEIINGDCLKFGNFIAEKLSFLYYDMENRTKGEETFVVINTTGEPLSATENLKPMLISSKPKDKQDECARIWEEWERFFWKNKGKNDTSDNGLKEFFRWIMLLSLNTDSEEFKKIQEDSSFKFDLKISFDNIYKYFQIVSEKLFPDTNALFPNNRDWLSPDLDGNSQIIWFRVLPVIQYLYRFPDALDRDIRRIRMFFRNLAKIPNVQKDIKTVLPEAIRITKEMHTKDICSILQLSSYNKTLVSDEVKQKLLILSGNPQRESVEEAFWEEEDCKIWSGEIMPMIQWSTTENGFDFELFKNYAEKFNKIFRDNLEYKELDITRRALLTRDLEKYPRIFKGNTNWSFAWNYEDWHALIFDNVQKFRDFLDDIDVSQIYEDQKKMINGNPSMKEFDEFVKIPELLEYCEQKKIQNWGKDLGWTLIKRDRASGEYANLKSYRLYLELKDKINIHDVWFYSYEGSCAVIDETTNHNTWAINAWHYGNDLYAIQLFHRDQNVSCENTFGNIPQTFDLVWNEKRYEKKRLTKDEAIELVFALIAKLS